MPRKALLFGENNALIYQERMQNVHSAFLFYA